MTRSEFLDEVKEIVCVSRQDSHGQPESTFERIAVMWQAYLLARWGLVVDINEVDVAMLMTVFKVARCMGNQENLENYLDMAGYAANAAEIFSSPGRN